MGKVGQLVLEAQLFAQDHFNMDRDEFYKHAANYQWQYPIQLREAVSHWEEIQTDMKLFDDDIDAYYDDPESPLYADSDLSLEEFSDRLDKDPHVYVEDIEAEVQALEKPPY